MPRIYLDNAATSWPKPDSVYDSIDRYQRVIGAPAGRGGYQEASEVLRLVEQTRGKLAEYIGATKRDSIAFTFSCTDALSTALFGLLETGDHVVTTEVEHNSVLRPLKHLESHNVITLSVVQCDSDGLVNTHDLIQEIGPQTRLICINHVSNVTGTIEPVRNLKRKMIEAGFDRPILLVDAAQSLGHVPINVETIGCDILAASGHKGLMGPLGTGILYMAPSVADSIQPFRFGGTGTDGSVEFQPTKVPDKFESGNLNVPGIAGLNAGLEFLTSEDGLGALEHSQQLSRMMLDGLINLDGVQLHGPIDASNRVGTFSISLAGLDCHEAASILDANWSIQTRAGLHCAPLIHRRMETETVGGTLRLSVGMFNTREQVETTIDALAALTKHV